MWALSVIIIERCGLRVEGFSHRDAFDGSTSGFTPRSNLVVNQIVFLSSTDYPMDDDDLSLVAPCIASRDASISFSPFAALDFQLPNSAF